VLSSFIPDDERIVTIEDAAELRCPAARDPLEARPPNIEGRGAITIRDLVRNALRMRPDRIVVGECRGGEALDMLQAMNTGHDGSLTTVHANTPRDVISRLETMVLMAGMDLPVRAIREQIASAIDLIVHESRASATARARSPASPRSSASKATRSPCRTSWFIRARPAASVASAAFTWSSAPWRSGAGSYADSPVGGNRAQVRGPLPLHPPPAHHRDRLGRAAVVFLICFIPLRSSASLEGTWSASPRAPFRLAGVLRRPPSS
jgi:hypothetical protein